MKWTQKWGGAGERGKGEESVPVQLGVKIGKSQVRNGVAAMMSSGADIY